jgi:ribosomal protein L21
MCIQIPNMFSKVALTATLAATLVLAPAALALEVEVDDVTLVDEDAAAGRDLLLSKTVSKKKFVTVTKPKKGKKVAAAKVARKKDIAGNEGDEGNEGNEGVFPGT